MECPLCCSNAPFESADHDDDAVTVEYRCDHGHIIQFLLPYFKFTMLIVSYDGDELYTLHFDEDCELIRLFDWRLAHPHEHFTMAYDLVQVDLEGTGTEVADDNNPSHNYVPLDR